MRLTYNFVDANSHNNGNVISISNYYDSTRSQQFTYDQLNRIATAEATSTFSTSPSHCWGEAYVYDNSTTTPGEYGNLTNINVPSTAYNGCTMESSLSLVANGNNQITTFSYDGVGNVLNDTHNSYTWNDESLIKTAAGVTYTYDGDGNRVRKSDGKIYWYGAGGQVLDESDSSGNITDEHVFFGGDRVAHRVVSGNAIYFYGQDALGTTRTVFTSAGALCYDADFYPFGGERAYTNTCTPNYKFTGKERDSESNLDNFGARYNASQFGRFMSPDPDNESALENEDDPQSWNGYSYARNNPLLYTDPDGRIYRICTTDQYGNSHCIDVSDSDFDNAQDTNGQGGNYLKNGGVYYTDQNGNQVQTGTYEQTSVDLNRFASSVVSQVNRMPIQKFIGAFAVGSVVVGATGGTACYYLCEEATLPTLGIEGAGGTGTAESEAVQLTEHAAQRLAERGISPGQAQEAIQTAEQSGNTATQTGKYGTPQTVYKGTNGVTVVVENAGRNAGKIITAYFH